MKLKAFLAEIGMSQVEFSKLVGCNYRYLTRIASGELKPGKRLARDIEELTDGNVKLLEQKPKMTEKV